MGAIQITDDEFQSKVIDHSKPVLVDFWAEWCGPCRMLAPALEAIAVKHADKLDVVKLNTDDNPNVPQKYEVMALPTCILFKDGQELARIVGFRSEDAMEEEILKALGV